MTTATPTRRRVSTTPPVEPEGDDVVQIAPGVYEIPDEEEGSRIEEKAPRIPTPTVSEQVENIRETANRTREKIRERAGRLVGNRAPAKKTGFKRPRSSVEGLISSVWSIGARVVSAVPNAWPVANVLSLQSPVAGKILEDTVKNTAIDGILQPFARLASGSQIGLALLGPPVLVGIASARPDSQPIVEPLLREALKAWLTVAGPKMIEKAKEEEEFQKEYGATIDEMVRFIFTPPEGMVPNDGSTVHTGQGVPA
jgi:hypothetical protein